MLSVCSLLWNLTFHLYKRIQTNDLRCMSDSEYCCCCRKIVCRWRFLCSKLLILCSKDGCTVRWKKIKSPQNHTQFSSRSKLTAYAFSKTGFASWSCCSSITKPSRLNDKSFICSFSWISIIFSRFNSSLIPFGLGQALKSPIDDLCTLCVEAILLLSKLRTDAFDAVSSPSRWSLFGVCGFWMGDTRGMNLSLGSPLASTVLKIAVSEVVRLSSLTS